MTVKRMTDDFGEGYATVNGLVNFYVIKTDNDG